MISEYRFERKWVHNNNDNLNLINKLIRSEFFFNFTFVKRKVNSIYFDDINNTSVLENLYGLENKKKIRIRWYGDNKIINNPRLEIKKKKGFITEKKVFNLPEINYLYFPNINTINKIRLIVEKKLIKKKLIKKQLYPILSTHYEREYLLSNNNLIRATIDNNISSINLKNESKSNINKNYFNTTILELKYPVKLDYYVRDKLKNMTLRLTKNSKFVNSIFNNPIHVS